MHACIRSIPFHSTSSTSFTPSAQTISPIIARSPKPPQPPRSCVCMHKAHQAFHQSRINRIRKCGRNRSRKKKHPLMPMVSPPQIDAGWFWQPKQKHRTPASQEQRLYSLEKTWGERSKVACKNGSGWQASCTLMAMLLKPNN